MTLWRLSESRALSLGRVKSHTQKVQFFQAGHQTSAGDSEYNDSYVLYKKFCLAFSSNSAVEICLPDEKPLEKCQFH